MFTFYPVSAWQSGIGWRPERLHSAATRWRCREWMLSRCKNQIAEDGKFVFVDFFGRDAESEIWHRKPDWSTDVCPENIYNNRISANVCCIIDFFDVFSRFLAKIF